MCLRIEELSKGGFDANKMFFSSVCCVALMFTKNVFHMFDAGWAVLLPLNFLSASALL